MNVSAFREGFFEILRLVYCQCASNLHTLRVIPAEGEELRTPRRVDDDSRIADGPVTMGRHCDDTSISVRNSFFDELSASAVVDTR
jgi:hypothetical protein